MSLVSPPRLSITPDPEGDSRTKRKLPGAAIRRRGKSPLGPIESKPDSMEGTKPTRSLLPVPEVAAQPGLELKDETKSEAGEPPRKTSDFPGMGVDPSHPSAAPEALPNPADLGNLSRWDQEHGYNEEAANDPNHLTHGSPKVLMVLAASGALVFTALIGMLIGASFGNGGARPASTVPPKVADFPAQALPLLDAAIQAARNGNSDSALETIEQIRKEYPGAPFLDYATALAAMNTGDFATAAATAKRSAGNAERRADALALAAAASSGHAAPDAQSAFDGGPIAARQLVEQAILADPLNPAPRLELASQLRAEGKNAEAAIQLQAARSLVHPVENAVAIEVTLALLEAEEAVKRGEPLAVVSPDGGAEPSGLGTVDETAPRSVGGLFAQAYVAASAGDAPRAAQLLRDAKEKMPDDTFRYLVADPLFDPLAGDPHLRALLDHN